MIDSATHLVVVLNGAVRLCLAVVVAVISVGLVLRRGCIGGCGQGGEEVLELNLGPALLST